MPPPKVVYSLLLLCLLSSCHGHVRLLFPPSRAYVDDLSSYDQSQRCDRRTQTNERTDLLAGSSITVEWSSAVPHSGGIQLDLINDDDQLISTFVAFTESYNISSTSRGIQLPSSECLDCSLRVAQSASEISPDTVFYSCATVNILKKLPEGNSCLGHGSRQSGKCICESGYIGDYCQHYVECLTDANCGAGGACQFFAGQKLCFCPKGGFGAGCQQNFSSDAADFDPSLYKLKMAESNKIYWRIVEDEVEFVLKYPGESWAAIGWKPLNNDGKCAALFHSATSGTDDKPIKTSDKKQVLEAKPATVTTPRTDAAFKDCGENEEFSKCPEQSRECEASCDWTADPDTIPLCDRDCGPERCICKEGYVRLSINSSLCVPFDACQSTERQECGANSTWAQCGTACEPSCSNMYDTSPCPASCESAACTCADNYVRHEGKCIYWGDCPDLDQHFIFDDNVVNETFPGKKLAQQQSFDSINSGSVAVDVPVVSAPLTSSCPANETVNPCGAICEANCISIFIRAQCEKCAAPACACLQGYARSNGTCVYWGDCPQDEISLNPTTSRTFVVPRRPQVTGSDCAGEWRTPVGCTTNCDYHATWSYMEKSDEIEFFIETRAPANWWTAIGFAETPTMTNADMIVVKSRDGRLSVHDMWSRGRGTPVEDVIQDVAVPNPIGSHSNGVLKARFKRRRVSRDGKEDVQFTDENCFYMLFPVAGGRLDAVGNISLHVSTPEASEGKICIRPCVGGNKPRTIAERRLPLPKAETKSCQTEYRYPPDCEETACEYRASWTFNATAQDVRFEISSKDLGRWTGIGFSKNGEMTNADIYTGWVYEGKAVVTDRYAYGRQLPAIDPSDRNDIYDVGGRTQDDIQTIWFRRSLVTKDSLTDLALDKCYFYLFPVGGGRVLARKSSDFLNPRTPIGYHDLDAPRVSPTKICICDDKGSPVPEQPPAVRRRRQVPPQQPPPPFNVPRNPFGESEDITSEELPNTEMMACVDMVVATTDKSGRGRVQDMFSIGTGTPLEDRQLGGSDSLTRASAVYENGMTTVTFRKKLIATEASDHSIGHAPMLVLWAKGVNPSSYRHVTGGQPIKADPSFFSSSAFRYHGMDNRGSLTVDFYADGDHAEATGGANDCHGAYSYPAGCKVESCQYTVGWSSNGHTVAFYLQATVSKMQWTAIGFSDDGALTKSDIVVVSVLEDGKTTVIDQFMPAPGRSSTDRDQDIFDVDSFYKDGKVYANFSRDLAAADPFDLSLEQCRFFLYALQAGSLDANGEMGKVTVAPTSSASRICLKTCSRQETTQQPSATSPTSTLSTPLTSVSSVTTNSSTRKKLSSTTRPTVETTKSVRDRTTTTTTTTMPIPPLIIGPPKPMPKGRFALKVRVLNREFVPDLSDPSSEYYKSFTKDLRAAVESTLAFKWKDVRMGKLLSYSKGSVVALIELEAMSVVPKPVEIKSVIEEIAVRGSIKGFAIEPTTVHVQKLRQFNFTGSVETAKSDPNDMKDTSLLWTIALVAVSVIALVVALVVFVCLCCRCRRVSHRFSPVASSNTKSYSDIPYKADPYPMYPQAGGTYPYGTLNLTKKAPTSGATSQLPSAAGFENKAYQHQRHFSQATTASTKQSPAPSTSQEPSPLGIGETTYQEWFSKVASKPSSQEHEECVSTSRRPSFVGYPNDAAAYYTLGGTPRSSSTRPAHY